MSCACSAACGRRSAASAPLTGAPSAPRGASLTLSTRSIAAAAYVCTVYDSDARNGTSSGSSAPSSSGVNWPRKVATNLMLAALTMGRSLGRPPASSGKMCARRNSPTDVRSLTAVTPAACVDALTATASNSATAASFCTYAVSGLTA